MFLFSFVTLGKQQEKTDHESLRTCSHPKRNPMHDGESNQTGRESQLEDVLNMEGLTAPPSTLGM